ncbi:hypothetical protein [uncultured Psychroserpens sp.]|uniref:hypothetical protein n=1 Tax=uncultured Psychroserpens sp. TaxID=255436 RepID=UPI0026246DBA|nr:hypothetical protein [uncultured Psychroserpens sp.]
MYRLESFKRIVIVADNYHPSESKPSMFSRDINRATARNVNLLKKGFEQIFDKVIVYDNQSEFLNKVNNHKNDIIFPYWYGHTSRNRQALIPSICEIENLIYVGADAYTNIICCDKVLSKDICRLNDVKYPKHQVIQSADEDIEWNYSFPVIIKPIYEGSSMGINKDSIQYDMKGAIRQIALIINYFKQPVIMEEFIPGKEVSLAIIGWKSNIKVWSAAERSHKHNESFFDSNVYGYDEKRLNNDVILKDARHMISSEMLKNVFKVFCWLDKVEYLRIDGKVWNNEFYCFELTNDSSLHPNGSFFGQLKYVGLDFKSSLTLLINNCLERHNNQHAN